MRKNYKRRVFFSIQESQQTDAIVFFERKK